MGELAAVASTQDYAGLKVLDEVDAFLVNQKIEIIESMMLSWYESGNRYDVFNGNGKIKLFEAKEKTNCCWRHCCSENRPFTIKLYDGDKKVLTMRRGFKGCGFAPLCCAHKIRVDYMLDDQGQELSSTSSATKISTVEVPFCHGGCCFPTLYIKDRTGDHLATVSGSNPFVCDCCGADFSIKDKHGKKIGELEKLGVDGVRSLAKELATDADNFKVTFPKDLENGVKLALIAALLQIDFSFFEDSRTIATGRCCDMYCCGWPISCLPAWLIGIICCQYCCNSDDKKEKGAPYQELETEMVR